MKRKLGRAVSILVMLCLMGMSVCAADAVEIRKNRVFQTISDVNLYESPDAASTVTAVLLSGTPVVIREDAQDGWCKVSYREETGYVQTVYLGILDSSSAAGAVGTTENGVPSNDRAVPDSESESANITASETVMKPKAENPENEAVESGDEAVADMEVKPANNAQPDAQTAGNDTDTLDDEFQRVRDENLQAYQEAEAAKEQNTAKNIWGIAIAVLVIAIFAVGITTTLAGNKGKKNQE